MNVPDESFAQLIAAMQAQTQAINRLAQSNEALVQAMIEDAGYEDSQPPSVGLSGRPL